MSACGDRGGNYEDDRDSLQRNSLRDYLVSAASAKVAAAAAAAAHASSSSTTQRNSSPPFAQSQQSSPPLPPISHPQTQHHSKRNQSNDRSTAPLPVPANSIFCSSSGRGGSGGVENSSSLLSQSAPSGGFLLSHFESKADPSAGQSGVVGTGAMSKSMTSATSTTRCSATSFGSTKRPVDLAAASGPSSIAADVLKASGDHRSPLDESMPMLSEINEPLAADASSSMMASTRESTTSKGVVQDAVSSKGFAKREFTGVRRLVGEFERKRHTVGSFTIGTEDAGLARKRRS